MRDSGLADTSNSCGNLYTGEIRKAKEKVSIPIGKENIRIPIAIDYSRTPKARIEQKLANVAICEITGCSFPIAIDPMLSLEFFWRSPLAVRKNAIKISFLPLKDMINLPAEYLAGTILCLLESEGLIEDRLKANERNAILVDLMSQSQLVETIVAVRKIVESGTRKELPKIAFSNWNKENFLSYLIECQQIITPTRIAKTEAEKELSLIEASKVSVQIRTSIRKVKNEAIDRLDDEDEITSTVDQDSGKIERKKTAAEMLREWQESRKGK